MKTSSCNVETLMMERLLEEHLFYEWFLRVIDRKEKERLTAAKKSSSRLVSPLVWTGYAWSVSRFEGVVFIVGGISITALINRMMDLEGVVFLSVTSSPMGFSFAAKKRLLAWSVWKVRDVSRISYAMPMKRFLPARNSFLLLLSLSLLVEFLSHGC